MKNRSDEKSTSFLFQRLQTAFFVFFLFFAGAAVQWLYSKPSSAHEDSAGGESAVHFTGGSSPALKKEIQRILKKSRIPLNRLGLAVSSPLFKNKKKPGSFSSKDIYFSHNGGRLLIPASLSKILTASCVLHNFQPFDQFETSFFAQKEHIKGERLKGPLYLKGGGDPSFVSEGLWNLVNHFTRSGIKIIEGGLVVDDSLFAPHKSQWFFDSDRSFNSALSAASFNWNSVNVYIRPALKLNAPARVYIDPENTYIQLENKSQTQGSKNTIQVSRIKKLSKGDKVQVKGSLPLDHPEIIVYRNVSSPALWTGKNTTAFLQQRGISVQGSIKKGKTPLDAVQLAGHKGRSVFRLVRDMMKFSNNFIAEMLAVQLSLQGGGEKGSLKEGLKHLRQCIESLGIEDYTFVQPSGLSRKNKLKPRDILRVLILDALSPLAFEKLSSYSIGGGDGTLKKKFQNLKNPVRAKTGWLSGVAGLAGYSRNHRGETRAFVFMYNGSAKQQFSAQKLFEELVPALSRY